MHWLLLVLLVLQLQQQVSNGAIYFSVFHVGTRGGPGSKDFTGYNITGYSFAFTDGTTSLGVASPAAAMSNLDQAPTATRISGLKYKGQELGVSHSMPPRSWACSDDISASVDRTKMYGQQYSVTQLFLQNDVTQSVAFPTSQVKVMMAPKRVVIASDPLWMCGYSNPFCDQANHIFIFSTTSPCNPNPDPWRFILIPGQQIYGFEFKIDSDNDNYNWDDADYRLISEPSNEFELPFAQLYYNRKNLSYANTVPAGGAACSSDFVPGLIPEFSPHIWSAELHNSAPDRWIVGSIDDRASGTSNMHVIMMVADAGDVNSDSTPTSFVFNLTTQNVGSTSGQIILTRNPTLISNLCGAPLCTTPCTDGEVCIGPDKCGCYSASCSTPTCPGPCPNGYCAPNATCLCNDGWSGNNCGDADCGAQGCLNGGHCGSPGNCECFGGWTGDHCETPECTVYCPHGSCVGDECTCSPESGWTGINCATPICRTGCVHGDCALPGQCNCRDNYFGTLCDQFTCTTPCQNGGSCVAPDTCDCSRVNFTGRFCEKEIKPIYFSIYNTNSLNSITSYSIKFTARTSANFTSLPVFAAPTSAFGENVTSYIQYKGVPIGVNGTVVPPQSWACTADLRGVVDRKFLFENGLKLVNVHATGTGTGSGPVEGYFQPQIGEDFYIVPGLRRTVSNYLTCYNTMCDSLDHFFVISSENPCNPNPAPFRIVFGNNLTTSVSKITVQIDTLNFDYTAPAVVAEVGTPSKLFSSAADFYVNAQEISESNPLAPGGFACSSDLGTADLPPLLSRIIAVNATSPAAGINYWADYNQYNLIGKREIPWFRYILQVDPDDQDFISSPSIENLYAYISGSGYVNFGTFIVTRDSSPFCTTPLCTTCSNGAYCVGPNECQCLKPGYTGNDCHRICDGTNDCVHGHCDGVGVCVCDSGFVGPTCEGVQATADAPQNVVGAFDLRSLVVSVKWKPPTYLGSSSYISSYILEMNNTVNSTWKVVSSSLTLSAYNFPPEFATALNGMTVNFRVTAKSYTGLSSPSAVSPPLVIGATVARAILNPYVVPTDDTSKERFFGSLTVIGTESVTCVYTTTVAPNFTSTVTTNPRYGNLYASVGAQVGNNTLTVVCTSSLGVLAPIAPLVISFKVSGGWLSIPSNIKLAMDDPRGPGVTWTEPEGALVHTYATTWTLYGTKTTTITRNYGPGTTYMYCEDLLYQYGYGFGFLFVVNTILESGSVSTLPEKATLYWGGSLPPPVIVRVDSITVDNGGVMGYFIVNPFPTFSYVHSGVFSFGLEYSSNNISWSRVSSVNLGANYAFSTVTVGGRLGNAQPGNTVYVRVFGSASGFPDGRPSPSFQVTISAAPDCSQVYPHVEYIYDSANIGLSVSWNECRDVGFPVDYYIAQLLSYHVVNTTQRTATFFPLPINDYYIVEISAGSRALGLGSPSEQNALWIRPPPMIPPAPQSTITWSGLVASWTVSTPAGFSNYKTGGLETTITLDVKLDGLSIQGWTPYYKLTGVGSTFSYDFKADTQNMFGVQTYSYRMTVTNWFGTVYSDEVTYSFGGAPTIPAITDFKLLFDDSGASVSSALVYWTSGAASARDEVQYSINGAAWVTGDSDILATTFQFTSTPEPIAFRLVVTPSTTIRFRVRSSNFGGNSSYAYTSTKLVAVVPQWADPSYYKPTFGSLIGNGVTVSWTAYPLSTGAPIYYLLRAYDHTFSNATILANTSATSLSVQNLPLSETYYFTVAPANAAGEGAESSFSDPCSLFVTPSIVANLTISLDNGWCFSGEPKRDVEYGVVWAESSGYPTSYTLQFSYSSDFSSAYTFDNVPCCTRRSCQQYSGVPIQLGSTLYVKVRGINGLGAGPWSAASSVTLMSIPTATGTPTVASVTRFGNGTAQANITWNAVVTGDPQLYYTLWMNKFFDPDCSHCNIPDKAILNTTKTWTLTPLLNGGTKYAMSIVPVSPTLGQNGQVSQGVIFYTGTTPSPLVLTKKNITSRPYSFTVLNFTLTPPSDNGGFPLFPLTSVVYKFGANAQSLSSVTYTYPLDPVKGSTVVLKLSSGYYVISAYCTNQLGASTETVVLSGQSVGDATFPPVDSIGGFNVYPSVAPYYRSPTALPVVPSTDIQYSVVFNTSVVWTVDTDLAIKIKVQQATLSSINDPIPTDSSKWTDFITIPYRVGNNYMAGVDSPGIPTKVVAYRAYMTNGIIDGNFGKAIKVPIAAPPTFFHNGTLGVWPNGVAAGGPMIAVNDTWGFMALINLNGPMASKNGDWFDSYCDIYFRTFSSVSAGKLCCSCLGLAPGVNVFVPFASTTQLNSNSAFYRTVVQLEPSNAAGAADQRDGIFTKAISTVDFNLKAAPVVIDAITLVADNVLSVTLSIAHTQDFKYAQYFKSMKLYNVNSDGSKSEFNEQTFVPNLNLTTSRTFNVSILNGVLSTVQIELTDAFLYVATANRVLFPPFYSQLPKMLPLNNTITVSTVGGTEDISFTGMVDAPTLNARCLWRSTTNSSLFKTSPIYYTFGVYKCSRVSWPRSDIVHLHGAYDAFESVNYWVVNVITPPPATLWPYNLPWGDIDFLFSNNRVVYLNAPGIPVNSIRVRNAGTNSTGYEVMGSNRPEKGNAMFSFTVPPSPSPPTYGYEYSLWGGPFIPIINQLYFYNSPPKFYGYDYTSADDAPNLAIWLYFNAIVPSNDIVIRFITSDGSFYTDFPAYKGNNYYLTNCPNNVPALEFARTPYCLRVVPYLLPWINYRVQVSWNGGYYFTDYSYSGTTFRKAVNFLASDFGWRANPLVTNCLAKPCDTCVLDPNCLWMELGSGVRICATASITISGAKNVNDCRTIQSELLPNEARNQRGLVIRQSQAPNNNYNLAITFPMGIYFDAAPSVSNFTYTCRTVDGGVGWTLQSTGTQNISSAVTRGDLETIYNIPKYADYIAPECRYIRPITSNPYVLVHIEVYGANPARNLIREETFNISVLIQSITPYSSMSNPTGGVYLWSFDYPSALTTTTVNLPGVVSSTAYYFDGRLVVNQFTFVPTYLIHYDTLSVGRHNVTVVVDGQIATRIFEVNYFPDFVQTFLNYLRPLKPIYSMTDMNIPGFSHQSWSFNLPTPIYNAIVDLNGAPLGLGGPYGADFKVHVQFDWFTTGAFTCQAGGAGQVKLKGFSIIMGFDIAVTMYRPQRGGYDLQRVDVAATAGAIFPLFQKLYRIPVLDIGVNISLTIGCTMTLRAKIANTAVEPLTGIYFPLGNGFAITGGGTVSIPIQFTVEIGTAFNGFYIFLAGAPFITLDLQRPFIVSSIGLSFAIKVGIPWLPPGVNSFTLFSFTYSFDIPSKRSIYGNETSSIEDYHKYGDYEEDDKQYVFLPKCHWRQEFVRGHSYARVLPNLDDGFMHEVRLVNDTYPSAWLSTSHADGGGNVMMVWVGQDDNIPFPASATLMWSLYSPASGQWSEPLGLEHSTYMDGMPHVVLYDTSSTSYAAVWLRFYGDTSKNASSTAYFDNSSTTAEVMLSFYNGNAWTTPINLTTNSEFDGAATQAVFYPVSNPQPNLVVMWVHKAEGNAFQPEKPSNVMFRIYSSSNVWSTAAPVISNVNISTSLATAYGDDSVVLAYNTFNYTTNVTRHYMHYFFSNNLTWSPPYEVAHLPRSPQGIEDANGTKTPYNDYMSEGSITIAYVNARYVFVWQQNGIILYRTWSMADGGSQIYTIIPPTVQITWLKLVESSGTAVLILYTGSGSRHAPSYYTMYEMLPSSVRFGAPAVLQGFTGYTAVSLAGSFIIQDAVPSLLIAMVQREVYDFSNETTVNDTISQPYIKVDAVVSYQVVPLQHSILLESVDIAQIDVTTGVIICGVANQGTTPSPATAEVSVYISGSYDFSLATSTLVAHETLPIIQSDGTYGVTLTWNLTVGYVWVVIDDASIIKPQRIYRYPFFTPVFDIVSHSTSVLAPGAIKLVTSVSNSLDVFPIAPGLMLKVILSVYDPVNQKYTDLQSHSVALTVSGTTIATAVNASVVTGMLRFKAQMYPDSQLQTDVDAGLISNTPLDLSADYFTDTVFNIPDPDLTVTATSIEVVNPFLETFLLSVPVENNGQQIAYNASVSIYINHNNVSSNNFTDLSTLVNTTDPLITTMIGDVNPLQEVSVVVDLDLPTDGSFSLVVFVTSTDPVTGKVYFEGHPIDNIDTLSVFAYPQSKFMAPTQYISVNPTTGAVSMAIINNLDKAISYPFAVNVSRQPINGTAASVTTLNFAASFPAFSCIIATSSGVPSLVSNLSTTDNLLITIPPLISGGPSSIVLTVSLANAIGVKMPDCSIPFTEISLAATPNDTTYVGSTYSKTFTIKAHDILSFVTVGLHVSSYSFVDNRDNTATFTFTPTFADVGIESSRVIPVVVGLTDGIEVYTNTTLNLNVVACQPPLVYCPSSAQCVDVSVFCVPLPPTTTGLPASTSTGPTQGGASTAGQASSTGKASSTGGQGSSTGATQATSSVATINPSSTSGNTQNPSTTITSSSGATINPSSTTQAQATSGIPPQTTGTQGHSSTGGATGTSGQSSTTQQNNEEESGHKKSNTVGIAVGVTIAVVAVAAIAGVAFWKRDYIRARLNYRRAPSQVQMEPIGRN